MKKYFKTILMVWICVFTIVIPTQQANAGIYEIIKAVIVKAIKAADLAIQRQQNRIVWLQNAQKVLENTMSKLKLDEISDWTQKQRDQYQQYFDELLKVKLLISYYQRIKDISLTQIQIVEEYSRTWKVIISDRHFTAKEIEYMGQVYSGILNETVKNVEKLSMIVSSFKTQMSDAKRLEIISEVSSQVERNYADLKTFNTENGMLSLQRSKSESEVYLVKKLYGID